MIMELLVRLVLTELPVIKDLSDLRVTKDLLVFPESPVNPAMSETRVQRVSYYLHSYDLFCFVIKHHHGITQLNYLNHDFSLIL